MTALLLVNDIDIAFSSRLVLVARLLAWASTYLRIAALVLHIENTQANTQTAQVKYA